MVELRTVLVISQVFGLIMLGLTGLYTGKYSGGGGFDWYNSALQFNFHPLFMVLGLIFLYGESILVYRALPSVSKPTTKLIHIIIHSIALILAIVGLIAAFDSHWNKPTLWTFHSWIGLIVVILFFFQHVCGFITFFKPGLEPPSRKWYLPIHQYFGLALFQLAALAVFTGITERLLSVKKAFGGENLTLNFLAVITIVFVWTVSYIITTEQFRRPTPPDAQPLPLQTSYESIGKRLSIP